MADLIPKKPLHHLSGIPGGICPRPQLIPLKLNEPQQRLFEAIGRCWEENRPVRILILKARQEGVSTLCEAIMFVLTALFPNQRSYIVAHDQDSSEKIFAMSRLFYDHLPQPIQPMTRYSNRKELLPWFALKEYRRAPEDPAAFTESLTEEELDLQKQYGLDLDQLAWRRWAIQNKCDGK